MRPLTVDEIRASFVNRGDDEIARLSLPGLHEVLWDEREYLGWRDPRAANRGYLVYWRADEAIGIALRASEVPLRAGIPAMCSLCHTTQPSSQVTMFTAARAGQAGRDGSSVGTYICADLACSLLIRMLPSGSHVHAAPDHLLAVRVDGLLARVEAFSADVTRGR